MEISLCVFFSRGNTVIRSFSEKVCTLKFTVWLINADHHFPYADIIIWGYQVSPMLRQIQRMQHQGPATVKVGKSFKHGT